MNHVIKATQGIFNVCKRTSFWYFGLPLLLLEVSIPNFCPQPSEPISGLDGDRQSVLTVSVRYWLLGLIVGHHTAL
jgi:hypothetical protein